VLDVPAATVSVTLAASALAVGQATQASAVVTDGQGNVLSGRAVAWQSSNPAMATVNASGLVTALAKSTVTISAIADARVGTAPLTITEPVPASIAIAPTSVSMVAGQTAQLTASVRDASGAVLPGQTVAWSSANPAVATITANGTATGVAVGTTEIHASVNGLDATAAVTITPVPAASISIAPAALSLTVGDTSRVVATVRDAGGNVLANRAVAWFSSNPAVMTVSATGLVTAVGAGIAAVSAVADGVTATAQVTVAALPPAPVASISVALVATTLSAGQTTQATATLRDAKGTILTGRTVVWSSASPEVATVSASGVVTAVSPGSASVIATSEGQTGAATVTVAAPAPAPVATVTLTGQTSLLVGQATQITAVLKDAAGNVLSGRTIGWTSSNLGVLTVSPTGLVTALGAGNATVTASSEGRSGSIGLTVTAPPETAPPEGGACSVVTGLARYPVSPLAKPGYLASVTEPEFGTRLTRVSGDPGAAIANVGGTWPTTVYGNYPKDPVWNADQSLLLLKHAGGWLFLDGASYQPLFRRSPPGTELRWHPTQPDVMVYVESNGSVGHWNVRTQSRTVRFAASGYSGARMGPNEGNLSRDGRWVVVNATRASDGRAVAYAVDVDAGAKGADLDLATQGVSNLDWAGISATGAYIVVHGVINGTSITTKVFSRATLALVSHWPEISRPAHFDLTVDAAGNEVAVGAAGGGVDSKYFIMRRLDNGAVTRLGPTGWNAHASARALGRPGWAYVVTNDATGSVLDGEMVALKLDGSGTVERYGRFRSATTDYEAYPMPVPSPDGKRILFASNWQVSGGRPVQAYVLDVCR